MHKPELEVRRATLFTFCGIRCAKLVKAAQKQRLFHVIFFTKGVD
jgi:hypothetical protein